jgi:predicted Zn-dependent protease
MKVKTSFLIYIITVFLLLISLKSFAEGENDRLWKINSYERKVNTVGQRILRANEISEMITFRVPAKTTSKSQVNASAEEGFAVITVERPLLRVIENDDELAAILSHEIVHIINRHITKHTAKNILIKTVIYPPCFVADVAMACVGVPYPFFTHFGKFLTGGLSGNANQKYELDADKTAVDLMVKAGYNPIYMETIYQRIMSDGSYLEFFRDHPKGSVRLATIHQKIAAEYPEFLEQKVEKVEKTINQKDILPVSDKAANPKPKKIKNKQKKEETEDINEIINYYN